MKNNETDIPIATCIDEDENGWIKFSTNDPQEYAPADSMAGIYKFWDNPNEDIYEVAAKKISGYYYEPFGMIFCAGDPNISFYQININLDGQYNVVKQTVQGEGTSGEFLITWTKSKYLEQGYNKENIVKIVKNGNVFTIFFNGQAENSFTETNPLNGKKIGLLVHYGKEGQEDFPKIPVDVRFMIK